jgi:hypothetical protein
VGSPKESDWGRTDLTKCQIRILGDIAGGNYIVARNSGLSITHKKMVAGLVARDDNTTIIHEATTKNERSVDVAALQHSYYYSKYISILYRVVATQDVRKNII